MMYLTVILNILVVATAIRVPTSWPEQEKKLIDQNAHATSGDSNNKVKNKLVVNQNVEQKPDGVYFIRNKKRPIGSYATELNLNNDAQEFQRPTVVPYLTNNNFQLKLPGRNHLGTKTNVRHNNLEKRPFLRPFVDVNHNFPSNTQDGWIPIAHQETRKTKKPNNFYESNIKSKQNHHQIRKPPVDHNKRPNRINHVPEAKNKTSDTAYKKTNKRSNLLDDDESLEVQKFPESELEIMDLPEIDHEIPVSYHEQSREVPTRPNYPGEGKWALRGIKHNPYAGNLQFLKPNAKKTEHQEPEEEQNEELAKEESEDLAEDDEEDNFTPTRIYSQVRENEREEHVPGIIHEPNLRESIKNSKIHTVYTEEGYEDVAYDHGGHEKNNQNSEGYVEFDKDAPKRKKYSAKNTKPLPQEIIIANEFENYDQAPLNDADDAEISASTNHDVKQTKATSKYGGTKETKTTQIKDMDNGDLELEITSEVKIMTQPNNTSKSHKYVKIIPKTRNSTLHFPSLRMKRQKRFVNDFPKTDVEKDFLDVLHIQKPADEISITTPKYPYYRNFKFLNRNSPLRYAEDLRRMPHKVEGEMSFYKHSQVSECPEVPSNIQVPKRVEQAGENEPEGDKDVVQTPDLPRIKNLGDKIDCLKAKLFGKNPLDSPIFEEEIIEQPEPIFDELNPTKSDSQSEGNQISVKLRNSSPTENSEENSVGTTSKPSNIYVLLSSINDLAAPNGTTEESHRQGKGLEVENSPGDVTDVRETHEVLPESAPLIVVRRRRRRRPQIFQRKVYQPVYGQPPLIISRPYPRIPPRSRPISEVFYKDDILPNEQLNVLADVMHNIKSSYEEPLLAEATQNTDNTWRYPTILANNRKNQVPSQHIRPYSDFQALTTSTTTTTTTTTTTPKPKRKTVKYKNHKPSSLVLEDSEETSGYTLKINHGAKHSHTQPAGDHTKREVAGMEPPIKQEWDSFSQNYISSHAPQEKKQMNFFVVAGMKPPIKRKAMSYSEFRLGPHHPLKRRFKHRVYKRSSNKPNYSEISRRHKPTEATTKDVEEDEYVPQRNRNFYYDVNSGQVIYTGTTPKEDHEIPVVEEEEEEEEEDGVEYLTLPKPPTPKPVVIVTTPRNGPSFLDVVKGLHNQPNYQAIPMPTKMPPGKTSPRPLATATMKSGEPPKFVNFIMNLKKADGYEEIPEKKPKTTTEGLTEVEYENPEFATPKNYNKMQIFDISEYLPNPMEYKPTHAIDYSKYKTINRAPSTSRHSISSRYNSEDETSAATSKDTATESSEYRRMHFSQEVPEEEVKEATTARIPTIRSRIMTPDVQRMRIRGRTRPTTTSTTSAPTLSTTTLRIRTRLRSRPTTTTTSTEATMESSFSQTQRVMYRRVPIRRYTKPNESIPSNHKEVYTPIVKETKSHVQRRRILPPRVLPKKEEVTAGSNNDQIRDDGKSRKLHHVEVFQKYDPKQLHGGNYRSEPDVVEVVLPTAFGEISDEMRLTDVVPKPFAFYSDRILPKKVNFLTGPRDDKEEVDELKSESRSDGQEEVVTEEEPSKIVKDPSKRLYYYAAVE